MISKSDVCPFDALSEVPVDDQRFESVNFLEREMKWFFGYLVLLQWHEFNMHYEPIN
jgi:hypothetical protein